MALGKKPKALLVLLGALLLGAMPFYYPVAQGLWHLYRANRAASAPQTALQAAYHLAQAAQRLPWRPDLWEKAGRLALQGGDSRRAVDDLQRAAELEALSPQGYLILGETLQQRGDLAAALEAWQQALERGEATPQVYAHLLQGYRASGDYEAAIAVLQAWIQLPAADATLHYSLGVLLATRQPEAALAHLAQAAERDPAHAARAKKLLNSLRTALLSDDPAYVFFEAGRALGSVDEWEAAAEAFTQALQKRPDFAEAWAFLGEARQHLERPDQEATALAALEKALSLDARSLSANTLMALYWQRQGQYSRAREYLQKATTFYPRNAALQAELGRTLALEGDLEAALRAYQKALQLAPGDPAYYCMLALFAVEHAYQVRQIALPAARQAVILAPNDPQALDSMGQVLVALGDLANAERYFQRALQAQPDFAAAHLHLGLVYALQGDMAGSRRQWNRVIALAPDSLLAEQARRLLKNYFP